MNRAVDRRSDLYALGVIFFDDSFATSDDTVRLPSFWRFLKTLITSSSSPFSGGMYFLAIVCPSLDSSAQSFWPT